MPFAEYAQLDGLALADLVRRREVTAAELVEEAIARIERHNGTLNAVILELFERLQDRDKAYFRESREKRFGRSLEDHAALADEAKQRLPAMLAPLSMTLNSQAWLGGDVPSYADYIALGAFQWVRTSSSFDLPGFAGEKVADWHAAMLDLHDGLARTNT